MKSPILTAFILFTSLYNDVSGQVNNLDKENSLEKFEITIGNSDYAGHSAVVFILTESNIKIIYRSAIVKKDSLLFSQSLSTSDTLTQISKLNLDTLKPFYSNFCIVDGSQIFVTLNKNGNRKSVHLSNYYHEDIGKIIYLVNTLVPEKYKVWYDKEVLMSEYKNCDLNYLR